MPRRRQRPAPPQAEIIETAEAGTRCSCTTSGGRADWPTPPSDGGTGREPEPDARAAGVHVVDLDPAAVGAGHRVDDREAEPGTPTDVPAHEPVDGVVEELGRETRTVVPDLDRRPRSTSRS